MAIDPMKKVTILCPVGSSRRLNRSLHALGTVELIDACRELEDAGDALHRKEVSTEQSDLQLQKLHLIRGLIDEFAPEQQTFLEGLTPLPLVIESNELDEAIRTFDLDSIYQVAHDLDDACKRAERRMSEIQAQLETLAPLEDFPLTISDLQSPQRVKLIVGTIPRRCIESFGRDSEVRITLAWEAVARGEASRRRQRTNGAASNSNGAPNGETVRIVAAYLPEDESAARRLLSNAQFEEITLPAVRGKVRDRIRELNGDVDECRRQIEHVREEAIKLSKSRRQIDILTANWESTRKRQLARGNAAEGRWLHVVEGYTRARDVCDLQQMLQRELPESSLSVRDPGPDDEVPVSITLSKLVRPIQMLVNLFGLPAYANFDPSPFIIFNFMLFFGICFGDVGYGSMLTLLGWYIARKTRLYEGVHFFARLLMLAGISTIIFGLLFGSWFGDLYNPDYLGENNPLLRVKNIFQVMDPLADPVTMLVAALGIGMMNQFYGIGLKMYGAARQGDWTMAFCDGLLWLIALPGMVIAISTIFVELPRTVFNVGIGMFIVGAIGLVLTQGRHAEGIVAKFGTGVVSLYGIVGSYGCTAFIGDTLSYCRLLALALTTSIVGLTVNMIAGLLAESVPYVGTLLFIVVLVVGHTFNFAISMLGAFVHAMRLIFVEFFGRFYEGGAKPFEPLGFDSPAYVLKRSQ
jgi:V/A-type H+-transporting ATPase subunit I